MGERAKQANDRELVLSRLIDAPREKLFRCWTDPKLMEQWFCPKPGTVGNFVYGAGLIITL